MSFRHILFRLTIILLVVMCLLGCGRKEERAEVKTPVANEQILDSNRDRIVANLPPASYLASQIRDAGAGYHPELLSDISLSTRHLSKKESMVAANLGAYIADFGYIIAYEDAERAQRTLEVCQQMAVHLGVEKGFKRAVEDQFEMKLEADDSLRARFRQMFVGAENVIDDQNIEGIQVAFLTGYFTEGLYLLVSVFDVFANDTIPDKQQVDILEPLLHRFVAQQQRVNDLLEILARFDMEERGALFYHELFEMNEEFQALDIQPYLESDGVERALKDPELELIATRIKRMRKLIVS
jgi:hypothetical protein